MFRVEIMARSIAITMSKRMIVRKLIMVDNKYYCFWCKSKKGIGFVRELGQFPYNSACCVCGWKCRTVPCYCLNLPSLFLSHSHSLSSHPPSPLSLALSFSFSFFFPLSLPLSLTLTNTYTLSPHLPQAILVENAKLKADISCLRIENEDLMKKLRFADNNAHYMRVSG